MKYANVIEVRDVPVPAKPAVHGGDPEKRKRIETLLRRYPDINEAEVAEIGHFLATGRHLDVGLVTGIDELKEPVRHFKQEHGRFFRLRAQEIALFLLFTAGPVAAMAWRYLL